MGGAPIPVVAGLGTSIVKALARQLGATVSVADGAPGVVATITCPSAGAAQGQA